MARRPLGYQVDTSDPLANLVLGTLGILGVALLGLIVWLGSDGAEDPEMAATSEQTALSGVSEPVSEPSPDAGADQPGDVPGWTDAPPDDPERATPSDADEPDAGAAGSDRPPRSEPADETPAASPPPAPTSPPSEPTGEGAADDDDGADDAGDREVVTGGTALGRGGSALTTSPDDPNRIPEITRASAPRNTRMLRADLDADGTVERVWAAIVGDVVRLRVERVVDGIWRSGRTVNGAVADRLIGLHARDLNGDGNLEVYTRQWVGTQGQSITVWAYRDGRLRRMLADGGCFNGENTFGIVGALVEPGRIEALCERRSLPPQQWPTAEYHWRDGRWTFVRLKGEYR